MSSTPKSTKDDKQVAAALAICAVATSLKAFNKALEDAIVIVTDPSSASKSKRLQSAKTLKDLKSCLSHSVDKLSLNVKVLDPIPSLDYVHSCGKKQPVLQSITNKRVNDHGPPNPFSKRAKTNSGSAVIPTPALPHPKNGKHYSKLEFVELLTQPNKAAHHGLMARILDSGLVPVKRRQAQTLLAGYKKHGSALKNLHKPWGETGREPILEFKDVEDIAVDLVAKSGYCLEKKDVEEALADKRKENMLSRGIQPLTDSNPSDTTVRRYNALIGVQPGVSITRTAVVKGHTRFTAENSIRSATSFITTAATSHFTLATERLPDVYKDVDQPQGRISDASKFLFDQVSKVHNDWPLEPVRRAYILSTDDTTEFVFKGQGIKNPKAGSMLVSRKSLKTAGTRSKLTTGPGEDGSGLRVKLTHTFAANGSMAQVFVLVCGLTSRELSVQDCPSGVLVLNIDGLGVGGHPGVVMFVRNDHDKETDKVRYRTYRDKVLLPFVAKQRSECDGWEEDPDHPIPVPDSMRVVSWCDGDLAQVATIIEEESLQKYKRLFNIVANKQSAARSTTEQSADLAKVFKSQHAVQRISTAANVDESNNHPMKQCVTKGFKEMKGQGLELNLVKRTALIDFLACLPETLARAATRSNIVHGFVANGLIGGEAKFQRASLDFLTLTRCLALFEGM